MAIFGTSISCPMGLSIVIFAEDYLPNIGGIASHVHNLAASLVKSGCRVEIISTIKHLPKRNLTTWRSRRKVTEGIDILEIPIIYSPKNFLYRFQMTYRLARIVRSEIRERNAQVFHWHNIHVDPEIASEIASMKISKIFTNHSSQFLIELTNEKDLAYNKANLSYADYIIAPSHELVNATVNCGINRDKVFYIPNGVNTSFYTNDPGRRNSARKKYGTEDAIAVICPRRVVPKCGVIYLAKALRHLKTKKELKIFFTGLLGGNLTWRDEDYESEVNAELTGFSPNIEVVRLPHMTAGEMAELYRAMDICILPSLIEATSISGLEAMASGLALIGTRVGGIPELIQHRENGILINKADETDLALAMDELAEDNNLRTLLGNNAQMRARNEFDWRIIAQKTIDLYQLSLT